MTLEDEWYYRAFAKILQGQEVYAFAGSGGYHNTSKMNVANISVKYFNSLSINLKELVKHVEFVTENLDDMIEIEVNSATHGPALPFTMTYQDSETLCFTRNKEEKLGVIRTSDTITLRNEPLKRFHDPSRFFEIIRDISNLL